MDGICGAVMGKINALGPNGRYFIISEDEFLEEFPEGAQRTGEELSRALAELAAAGYIEIKYSSGNMYCVAAVKNYPLPSAGLSVPPRAAKREEKSRAASAVFWAAFAGGAAGGIVAALFCLLFLLC